jgi:hypothetical protein
MVIASLSGSLAWSAPARQLFPEVGAVEAIALDASGNGWAWAHPAPQRPGTNYLLRIENGDWRIAEDTTTRPDLLPSGATIYHMAVASDLSDGWAVGRTIDEEPLVWRLLDGRWQPAELEVPATATTPRSMSLTADGSDGWLTVSGSEGGRSVLLRMVNGAWRLVPEVDGGRLEFLAVGADGKSGWGVGFEEDGEQIVYRYANGAWTRTDATIPATERPVTALTVDNSGAGWGMAADALWRFKTDGTVTAAYRVPDGVSLLPIAVDPFGRGWALGWKELGQVEQPGGFEIQVETVAVRLLGDTATQVDPESAFLLPEDVVPRAIGMTPGGGQVWAGASTGIGFGRLINFREPWPANDNGPAGAAPLPGAGRCFAEVSYCLRGAFLRFWERNGGLDVLGLPITPEVVEKFGDTELRVQYTERARLEEHAEFRGTPHEVLLGLLGNALADPRAAETPFKPVPASAAPATEWFEETGHNVGPPFLRYWQTTGGLRVYGLPRSEAFEEVNQADGKTYRVQYFERNRIEHHPEHTGTQYEFLLGLLGVEHFKATYGYTP